MIELFVCMDSMESSNVEVLHCSTPLQTKHGLRILTVSPYPFELSVDLEVSGHGKRVYLG